MAFSSAVMSFPRSLSLLLLTFSSYTAAQSNTTSDKASLGAWGPVIQFPVIPAGAFVVSEKPRSTRLLLFSAFKEQTFGYGGAKTQFADYNTETGVVSQRTISNTQHEMFCPGISAMQDGRVIITGGSDAARASIFDPSTNSFVSAPNMTMARGYQASVTLSSGKVFTIGGSWSGGVRTKDGEIYDPATNEWTKLPGALVKGALTEDIEVDKRDNHMWFFGWRDNSVFQAGPSRQMNWYSAAGTGSVQAAGTRDAEDAMCGIFVMYDALRGKILTAGGSTYYHNVEPNNRANHITIGAPGSAPIVERLPSMAFPRAFANAVVLPTGHVLITGGQTLSRAFTDENSTLVPELFDPKSMTFRQLTPMVTPRNYHSTSLLLADGRVFTGGGGLCYDPNNFCPDIKSDHPDGEIFSPPYLFNADGSNAQRPVIMGLSTDSSSSGDSVKAGGSITVTVDKPQADLTFAMLRAGTNTHSVNTDQRRVPMEDVQMNGSQYVLSVPNDYGIMIPGDWFVFVISGQGTPSVAQTVTVAL
ncbi:related to galactose oxidase precursor [Rhynchosporium agropyri]|uniref:Related to galactose oxidase n=1 Tax=Rhynchosporium agropyri TaxID=914238 RepID=A0A1E1JXW7_9HELO|nr:related to galactose oxidase precursor [Rhynchosporium agropyri]